MRDYKITHHGEDIELKLYQQKMLDKFLNMAKYYFEVLREIIFHSEIEKLSVSCSLIY